MNKIKYGLNLRGTGQQKKPLAKTPIATPFGFGDEDEDDVEREIARQASKSRALKEIKAQKKQTLEEDPTVFDYDGVYDEMKQNELRPVAQDRGERKPKYIVELMKKAKERQQQNDLVYERKLAKERSKEDHLYGDTEKFVTAAYGKKLQEQEKLLELERLCEIQEERDDVTKKKDLLVIFYTNLNKNRAFGAGEGGKKKAEQQTGLKISEASTGSSTDPAHRENATNRIISSVESSGMKEQHQGTNALGDIQKFTSNLSSTEDSSVRPDGNSSPSNASVKHVDAISKSEELQKNNPSVEQPSNLPKTDHHKRNQDALASAKERFLARKKAKDQ